jgi:hypothetical protein
MTANRPFRGYRFPPDMTLWAVRWYLQFAVSFRDLELMLADGGVQVDHVTLYRWNQRVAPEIEACIRRHLCRCRSSWHVNETYVRIRGGWRYLYRAVDPTGQTIGEHHPLDAGGLLKRSSQAVSTPDACAFRVIVPSRVFRYGPTLGTVQQRVGWQV